MREEIKSSDQDAKRTELMSLFCHKASFINLDKITFLHRTFTDEINITTLIYLYRAWKGHTNVNNLIYGHSVIIVFLCWVTLVIGFALQATDFSITSNCFLFHRNTVVLGLEETSGEHPV